MSRAWQELDVDAGGVRLHVRRLAAGTTGSTQSMPMVLLHGLGVSGAVWQSFARRLAPPWPVIAPDLRGHGRSAHPPSGTVHGYDPTAYAGDVGELMRALGVHQAPLVGHSLGALVALTLAAATPERVPALVLLDPPLDASLPNPDVEQVYRLRHAPPGELEAYLSTPTLAPLFRQATDEAFAALLAAPPGAPWAWAVAPAIRAPILLVQADPAHGGLLHDHVAREFVDHLPNGSLLSIAGAPHAVHASHPAQLAEALLTFLAPWQV